MSPSKPLGTLIASPGIPGIEVALFDGRLRRIPTDDAADEFRWSVPRGIYKVRYQAGSAMDEHTVTVDDVTEPVRAPAPRLEFTSSAPLQRTSSTHEYHTAPAVDASRKAPEVRGKGAALFAMVRSRGGAFRHQHPTQGLTLRRDGAVVVDFADFVPGSNNTCAAGHVALDPGAYTLRYETAGCVTNQTIFVTPDWQTQIFISEAGEGAPVALDIAGLAVLMARPGQGFDPGSYGLHAAELARKALRRGQSAISPRQIRELLQDKFDNPMLGILGAHLMLLRRTMRRNLLEEVVLNLERLVPGHPDLACLRLALEPHAAVKITAPPMLARSWDLLVKASANASLESPAFEEAASSIWDTGGAWLTWGHLKETAQRSSVEPVVDELHLFNYSYKLRPTEGAQDLLRQVVAGTILRILADESTKEPLFMADGRTQLLRLKTPLGSALSEDFDLNESEAAFVNVAAETYARNGREGLTAEALAPHLRMPAALVRLTAQRLADRLDPPRPRGGSTPQTPVKQSGGGAISQSASS